MSQLAAAWAEDDTLKENLWHCVFGSFSRQLDWENEFKKEAMERLWYEYLEDENEVGTKQRGKKGCIAKLARQVKKEIVKSINRKPQKLMD